MSSFQGLKNIATPLVIGGVLLLGIYMMTNKGKGSKNTKTTVPIESIIVQAPNSAASAIKSPSRHQKKGVHHWAGVM